MPPRGPWSDKVTALLAQFPGPVTLHPSNLKLIAFVVPLAIGDGFIIHGLWSILPRLSGKALVMVGVFLVVPVLLLIFLAAMTYWQHLRIDIEGFEVAALQGAAKLLTRCRGRLGLVVEMHPFAWGTAGTSGTDFQKLLSELSLTPFPLTGQQDVWTEYGLVHLRW